LLDLLDITQRIVVILHSRFGET